jgi:hypothetical protein
MNHPKNCPFSQGDYLLLKQEFVELCRIHDRLMFMTYMAGTASTNGDNDVPVFIRRSMIGEAFRDVAYQLGDLLETIRQDLDAARAARGSLGNDKE